MSELGGGGSPPHTRTHIDIFLKVRYISIQKQPNNSAGLASVLLIYDAVVHIILVNLSKALRKELGMC